MKKLATIGKDDGKKIRYANGVDPIIVGPTECDDCSSPAVSIYQGETDSYGFETIALCDKCAATIEGTVAEYHKALDVKEMDAGLGKVFVVNETTNIGSDKVYELAIKSYRAAVGYLRRSEDRAANMGGLHPNQGVQLLKVDELPSWVSQKLVDMLKAELSE